MICSARSTVGLAVALLLLALAPLPAHAGEERPPREVTVLHMADTHAALEAHHEIFFDAGGAPVFRPAGGYALLAAAIQAERAARPGATLLVNVGDTFHGSAVAEWTEGAAIVPVVNALGIDVFVPGNWDYAYGPQTFRRRMRELNHPVAALNLVDATTGERLFARSVVRTVNGVRVAVIGITSVIVDKSMAPDYSRGLRFTFKEGAQAEVDRLRRDGVEVVVLATELGLAQETRLARELKDVDFIFGGHTHERTERPVIEGGVPVVQSGSEGSFLSRVTFRVRGGRVAGYEHRLVEVTPERYRPDPQVSRLVEEARRPFLGRLGQVYGNTETTLFRKGILESTMDNLVGDALLEATGADIGLTNGFRFAYPVLPGPLTEESLHNILPLDAPIKLGTVTGRQLREFWERGLEEVFGADPYGQRGGWGPRPAGMEVRVRLGAPRGQRVVWMKVGGREVGDDDRFRVASCERPGDGPEALCRITGATETRVLSTTIHDALRSHLRRHGRVAPRIEGRVSAEDARGHVWSQYELGKVAPGPGK